MRLIIVRHGEAESNKQGFIGGQLSVSLTEKGKKQAKKIAEYLKDEKFDLIFCSTLKRAKQTAKEILKFHPSVEVIYDKRLMEINWGEFQGKNKKFLRDAIESFEGNYLNFKPKNGESLKDLKKRVNEFLKKLKDYKNKTILIVSHGRTIRAIVSVLLDKNLKDFMEKELFNTAITEIKLKNGKFKMIKFNAVDHLKN